MYIPAYKKKMIIRKIIFYFILITIIFGAYIIYSHTYGKAKEKDVISVMNARELMYDADGPFIMVNTTDNLIGFYMATHPIYHDTFYGYIEPGVYDIEYDELSDLIIFKETNTDIMVLAINAYNNKIRTSFQHGKALVYSTDYQ